MTVKVSLLGYFRVFWSGTTRMCSRRHCPGVGDWERGQAAFPRVFGRPRCFAPIRRPSLFAPLPARRLPLRGARGRSVGCTIPHRACVFGESFLPLELSPAVHSGMMAPPFAPVPCPPSRVPRLGRLRRAVAGAVSRSHPPTSCSGAQCDTTV